ncbi:MAG TPA: hypothetical protein VMF06_12495 [Candidatus Limnocylindria bacterium]|nr:hypothetical protein [Candidatus Limnocylindria bacterium]
MNSASVIVNPVYSIRGASADASIWPKGLLQIPTFSCKACGLTGSTCNPWYASIEITKAQIAAIGPLPEKVASYEEFHAIRQRVGVELGLKADWPPGSHLGSALIEITRKHATVGLSPLMLESGIEYVSAALSGSLISLRLAQLLESNGVAIRWGKVILRNKITHYEYAVLQPKPKLLWTEAERQKWNLTVCQVCGSALKKKSGGTFLPKEFERSIFETGRVLVYGAEVPQFHLNEMTKALIESAQPKGLEFYKEGNFS